MEIFGYDFILDLDYNVWLIEVNTNPCIEESSPLLEMLLPRMIGRSKINHHVDDAFVLTLDQIFVRREKPIPKSSITLETESVEESTTQEKVIERERSSPYKVTGYLDSENMWYVFALNINRDLIGNLNDSQKVNSYRRPQPYNLNHIKL